MSGVLEKNIILIQGILGLISVILFLFGYFFDYQVVMIIGGLLLLLDDFLDFFAGALNPLFLVIFAVLLASLITPWYVGVFWSAAVFRVFDIPTNILKIINSGKISNSTDKDN